MKKQVTERLRLLCRFDFIETPRNDPIRFLQESQSYMMANFTKIILVIFNPLKKSYGAGPDI
ncbi:MAG: hypothetical protein A2Y10_01530 [Planctomycetes bacterium GWF2_41_51]|nr:MAG: hypothetical protein A2Y10_01530 [Planctomycetes bacterium GWF2_41_51]HBG25474.1 hypothetical protein [Phycisphaerales bacterium]